jgi:hypothetical protein
MSRSHEIVVKMETRQTAGLSLRTKITVFMNMGAGLVLANMWEIAK